MKCRVLRETAGKTMAGPRRGCSIRISTFKRTLGLGLQNMSDNLLGDSVVEVRVAERAGVGSAVLEQIGVEVARVARAGTGKDHARRYERGASLDLFDELPQLTCKTAVASEVAEGGETARRKGKDIQFCGGGSCSFSAKCEYRTYRPVKVSIRKTVSASGLEGSGAGVGTAGAPFSSNTEVIGEAAVAEAEAVADGEEERAAVAELCAPSMNSWGESAVPTAA